MSVAGIYSSYADYKLPNGQYLSDSRMEDMGGKLKLGYNSGKWALESTIYIRIRQSEFQDIRMT